MTIDHLAPFPFLAKLNATPAITGALKEHAQFPAIIDILARLEQHHVFITQTISRKVELALLSQLSDYMQSQPVPAILRGSELYCLKSDVLRSHATALTEWPRAIANTTAAWAEQKKCLILIIDDLKLLTDEQNPAIQHVMQFILHSPWWRIIAVTSGSDDSLTKLDLRYFQQLKLAAPTESQLLAILKSYQAELEAYHQVTIAEDTFATVLAMARHYLANNTYLDQAYALLESAAARASTGESVQTHQQPAIVTSLHAAQVVSNWTQIPLTHLQHNKFQTHKFIDALKQNLYGQDLAVQLIGGLLQGSYLKLYKKSGPLCSLLLAGPAGVGKTTLVKLMTEHLFGNEDALLHLHPLDAALDLTQAQVTTGFFEQQAVSFLSALQQTPYAIILLEDIDQYTSTTLQRWQRILVEGHFFAGGTKYDLSNAIIVMTTTLGAERLSTINQGQAEKQKTFDLLQLVLNEPVAPSSTTANLSPAELTQALLPELAQKIPENMLQALHIIPFVPLDYAALEKIIRIKLKVLAKRLDIHFGIEVNYAPEVIKFLSSEASWQMSHVKSLDRLLEQQLYQCVAHEILAQPDERSKRKRLLLQLNDTGQMLRCSFVAVNEVYRPL